MRMPIGPAFRGDAGLLDAQYLSSELFSSVPRAPPPSYLRVLLSPCSRSLCSLYSQALSNPDIFNLENKKYSSGPKRGVRDMHIHLIEVRVPSSQLFQFTNSPVR